MKKNALALATAAAVDLCNRSDSSDIRIQWHCVKDAPLEPSVDAVTQMNSASGFGIKFLEQLQRLERDICFTTAPLNTNVDGSIHGSVTLPAVTGSAGIIGPEATISGKFESLLEEVMLAFECVVVGYEVAQRAALSTQSVPAEIRPAKSTQKLRVALAADGHIYVTNPAACAIVKKYLPLIMSAMRVNLMGMVIVVTIGPHRYRFPVLRDGATKITPIVVGTRTIIAPVYGYFRCSRTAEFVIGGKIKTLKASDRDAGALRAADRADESVEMVVEVSRPSNPFLGNEETFRIVEVLKVTNVGKQERLTFDA